MCTKLQVDGIVEEVPKLTKLYCNAAQANYVRFVEKGTQQKLRGEPIKLDVCYRLCLGSLHGFLGVESEQTGCPGSAKQKQNRAESKAEGDQVRNGECMLAEERGGIL